MERRRQARTPVNINALLIGEKTVPKGCRVMNVSESGMLLHCDADGRLLTFKSGDTVEVHLTVQHEGKQKKLTIPSCVRHVAANSVDVEFNQPDPLLTELIESYRVSEKHKLEATLGRMDRRAAVGRVAAVADSATDGVKSSGQAAKHTPRQNYRPFYTVIFAIVFAVCIITGGYVYTASIDSRISTLESITERQSTELADMQNRLFSATLQEGRYASLNARLTALGDAFVSLENRLGQVIPSSASASARAVQPAAGVSVVQASSVTSMPEAAAAASPKPDTAQQEGPGQPAAAVPDAPAATPPETPARESGISAISRTPQSIPDAGEADTVTDTQRAGETGEAKPQTQAEGPWVINLLSSRDKAYVEQFSRKSGAKEVNAELNSAMVNGRQYWRLQITGFESAARAREHARTVKQQLGIKEVWIFKRK